MRNPASSFALAGLLTLPAGAIAQISPPAEGAAGAAPAASEVKVRILELPASPTEGTKFSLDSLKAGKLIGSGFSLGAAYGFHIPAEWPGTKSKASDTSSSLMPYLVFYPGMFFPGSGEETRAYCAADWALEPSVDVQRKADAHAVQRALRDVNPSEHGLTYAVLEAVTAEQLTTRNPEKRKGLSDLQVTSLAAAVKEKTGWELGKRPYCRPRLIGLFVGKPAGISPTVRPADDISSGTPAVSSVVSFGAAWSPNIAVSLLAGLTYWTFPSGVAPSENRGLWTWTVGVGGNTDILGALIR